MDRYFTTLPSPVGALLLTSDGRALTGLYLEEHAGEPVGGPEVGWKRSGEPFLVAIEQLNEYFAGRRREFDVPLAAAGTDFQQRVWAALATIPFGETRSYGDIARSLGQPGASRAVGLANGQNPISIIVPCHRVIGANGTLTGYGGGLERKRWLLEHEGALAGQSLLSLATPLAAE
ncbi:MAG: methylated-DNA--[protein]-cysteine S-methyltransferase [Verrucomicrobiales bacterium]